MLVVINGVHRYGSWLRRQEWMEPAAEQTLLPSLAPIQVFATIRRPGSEWPDVGGEAPKPATR